MQGIQFLIESRETPGAAWQVWPLLAPFAHREDAIIQATHLTSVQPAPTRCASSVREFRVAESRPGCPKCLVGVDGPVCAWHRLKAQQGASVPAPQEIAPRRPMQPTPQPRQADGTWASRRYSAQAEAIGASIRQARESAGDHSTKEEQ